MHTMLTKKHPIWQVQDEKKIYCCRFYAVMKGWLICFNFVQSGNVQGVKFYDKLLQRFTALNQYNYMYV